MCTNVHGQGPIDRMVDPQRASALCKWPGRPGGRPLGHSPVFGRPTGRSLFPTVRNQTVGGRLGGRPTAENSAELSSTASFWSILIWGYFGLFVTRFWVSFQASFSYLSKCLSPLVLEPNTSISKGEFFKSVLRKRFLELSPQILSEFFSHIFELSIATSIL